MKATPIFRHTSIKTGADLTPPFGSTMQKVWVIVGYEI